MALEDRIRSSVDAALPELTARFEHDVRGLVEQLVSVAREERDQAIDVTRRTALEQAEADTRIAAQAAEARLQSQVEEAGAQARVRERESAMVAVSRLLDSVRGLDAATALGEVLDALGQAAGREASRAAVLVLRNERLLGWRLMGFGASDTQPKGIDLGLKESGVIGLAVGTARTATTRDTQDVSEGPGFAHLPADCVGFAVPVIVGGRVVAVVYADSVESPEVIEILARHAGRCLEALTVQKTATPSRFWVAGSAPAKAAGTDVPPGVGA